MKRFRKKGASSPSTLQKVKASSTTQNDIEVEDRPKRMGPPPRYFLDRGWKRIRLINELARETKTQREIAKEFGCSQSRVRDFKKANYEDIQLVKAAMDDEFRATYTAQKTARVSELEQDVVDCNVLIRQEMQYEEPNIESLARLWRAKQKAVRLIAEELGQIPRAVDLKLDKQVLEYFVQGADLEAMK